MPDPKLKDAMEEIKTVLQKYDIAADVVLSSPTHMEYLRHLKTSWCCCWMEPGGLLRVRCKRADFPSKEAHAQALRLTVGTIAGFADALRSESENMVKVLVMLQAQGIEFEHMTKEEQP